MSTAGRVTTAHATIQWKTPGYRRAVEADLPPVPLPDHIEYGLEKCPFCGHHEVKMSYRAESYGYYPHAAAIRCPSCRAHGPSFEGEDVKLEATTAWNTELWRC